MIQLLFVAVILAATTAALCDHDCCEVLCEEALKGAAAGLLYGMASIVSRLSRERSMATLTWRVIARELRVGLVAGFLLGLTIAVALLATGG